MREGAGARVLRVNGRARRGVGARHREHQLADRARGRDGVALGVAVDLCEEPYDARVFVAQGAERGHVGGRLHARPGEREHREREPSSCVVRSAHGATFTLTLRRMRR